MTSQTTTRGRLLDPDTGLDSLIQRLLDDGFHVIGPIERAGSIEYAPVRHAGDLPTGLSVEQSPGRWRARHDDGHHRFGWTPAADSWKRWFFPPDDVILSVRRRDGSFTTTPPPPPARPLALIGARDCELRALDVLDRVLADPAHPDPRYIARRAATFVVAVTCGRPSATCWCTSMGGGPRPSSGFDIVLTELDDGDRAPDGHRLVAEAGTDRGAALLDALGAPEATAADLNGAAGVAAAAAAGMTQRLDGASLADQLAGTDLHSHWDDVAARCLSCGSCTLVCPTCFCSRIEDRTGLAVTDDGSPDVERHQRWASCFELDHSNLVGRPVRATTADRYRQWLLHKLHTWPAQFGTAGCVGCGRCTTWCPAGIDLPREAIALLGDPAHDRQDDRMMHQ